MTSCCNKNAPQHADRIPASMQNYDDNAATNGDVSRILNNSANRRKQGPNLYTLSSAKNTTSKRPVTLGIAGKGRRPPPAGVSFGRDFDSS